MKLCALNITTFRDSGIVWWAKHYYGTLHYWDNTQEIVTRRVGDLKDRLNEDNADIRLYEEDDRTSQFYDVADVQKHALEVFLADPRGCDCLVAGMSGGGFPQEMLYGPEELMQRANEIADAYINGELDQDFDPDSYDEHAQRRLVDDWLDLVKPEPQPRRCYEVQDTDEVDEATTTTPEPIPAESARDVQVEQHDAEEEEEVTDDGRVHYYQMQEVDAPKLPIRAVSLTDKNTREVFHHPRTAEAFYFSSVDVSNNDDVHEGTVYPRMDGTITMVREYPSGRTVRLAIAVQDIWAAALPLFDKVSENPRQYFPPEAELSRQQDEQEQEEPDGQEAVDE